MPQPGDSYLGDGAYVSFDGYMLRLSTDREGIEHFIYLEPTVYEALTNYVARIREAQGDPTDASE